MVSSTQIYLRIKKDLKVMQIKMQGNTHFLLLFFLIVYGSICSTTISKYKYYTKLIKGVS